MRTRGCCLSHCCSPVRASGCGESSRGSSRTNGRTSPTDHEQRARPGLGGLPRPRLRSTRRRARRNRQPRRRLRLQLRSYCMHRHTFRLLRRVVVLGRPVAVATAGVLPGGSRRRAVPPLRRRRREDRRAVAAGAQEVRREVFRLGQLLRRHGLERVHRRHDDGEPVQGRAHARQSRLRHAARQDPVQRGFTHSDENDYTANTASLDVSQDIFGDLTTVSFGFSQGWDEVRKRGDAAFFSRPSTGATTASACRRS